MFVTVAQFVPYLAVWILDYAGCVIISSVAFLSLSHLLYT